MKKGIRQKRGLAVFIAATMVVGLMPGLDIEKASAAKSGESTMPQVEGYSDDGFCDNYEWKNGSLILKEGITACETHTDCNGYQPAVEEVLDFDINGDKKINGNDKAYKITNAGQLYWFAGLVNGTLKGVDQNRYANAILTQSITVNKDVLGADGTLNSLTDLRYWTPIGNGKNRYKGRFDGKNYTISGLYFNDTSDDAWDAGIAMKNSSNTKATIDKCISDVTIQSTVSGDATHGGIIGVARGTVYITSCAFTGAINGSSTHSCGGIIGYIKGYADIRKSYVAASFGIKDTNCNTICRNGKLAYVIGCYYLNNIGSSINGASQKPKEAFANGEVAYLLQGEQREAIWGQRIGIDRYPVLDGTKKVYRYEVRNNSITTYIYSNSGIPPVYSANAVSDVGTLKTKSEKQTKTTVTLEWSKESKADGYLIYGS